MISFEDFIKTITPFTFGSFLSRFVVEKEKIITYSSFKRSKFLPPLLMSIRAYSKELLDSLNYFSGIKNWSIEKASDNKFYASFEVKNDLKLDNVSFYNFIWKFLIKQPWFSPSENIDEHKKEFLRGFIEMRGSIDTTRKFISQDYFYSSEVELKRAALIAQILGIPISFMNINFRQLQKQFVSGENRRNTQLRINSFYYGSKIGFINHYKAAIFKKVFSPQNESTDENNKIIYFNKDAVFSETDNISFIKYLNFFTNNIFHKQLNEEMAILLREKIGFKSGKNDTENARDSKIIRLFRLATPDKCAICGTTKTYQINDGSGRQYFEIHHMISFCNGKEFDNIANLVKLCPTCHRMLKKGGAPKEEQEKAIRKILSENDSIMDFVKAYLGDQNIDSLTEKIWKMLG